MRRRPALRAGKGKTDEAEDDKEDVEQDIGFINFECKPDESNKVELVIPTVSGFHLICKPFDTSCFLKRFNHIDIHKNNPTLLYYEKN